MKRIVPERYFVVLVDLVHSQKLVDRKSATTLFKKAIKRVNENFKKCIISPMEITRGDEAAAVLKSISTTDDIVFSFIENIHPLKVRIVIIYGELTTEIKSRRSTEIDGPAFQLADYRMKELKKTNKRFHIYTNTKVNDAAINSLMNLLIFRWEQLTDIQQKVLQLYRLGKTQKEISIRLHKTQQQISQTLRSLPYDIIEDGKETLKILFKDLSDKLTHISPDIRC